MPDGYSRPALILSVFPGLDLLGRAFEDVLGESICVVRGPDVLWGGDARTFHPPPGVFWGVIGGPPCQAHSSLQYINRAQGREPRHPDLIPEFARIVREAHPAWWLMENVPPAPTPETDYPCPIAFRLNNRWVGGEQNRTRRIAWAALDGRVIRPRIVALEAFERIQAVCANGTVDPDYQDAPSHERKHHSFKSAAALALSLRAQGLPDDLLAESPFTLQGKHRVVGNGVPMPMGRALAAAVARAYDLPVADRYGDL